MSTSATIQAERLSKRYGRQQAVDDLTFAVEPGQIAALLGPNGAGKTSTIRMLVGLTEPDAGTVLIDQPHRGHEPRPVDRLRPPR